MEKIEIAYDEAKKTITITIPDGNTVEINGLDRRIRLTDPYNNEVAMDIHGITLNSHNNITLKARDSISLDARNVNVQANGIVSVKATAAVELSSSGVTTVKGSIVKIN